MIIEPFKINETTSVVEVAALIAELNALRTELTALRAECEGLREKVSEYEKALRWIDKYGGCSHPANFVSVARAALRKFDAAMNEGRSDE